MFGPICWPVNSEDNSSYSVAVGRQFASSCGFYFNCGLERPGHGSGSCPNLPACLKSPGPNLSLLHTDNNNNSNKGRFFNQPNDKDPKEKRDKPSRDTPAAGYETENTVQSKSCNSNDKSGTTPVSSAGIVTAQFKCC